MRASHTGEGSRVGVVIGEQARTSHIGEGFPAGAVIGEQTSHTGEGPEQEWSWVGQARAGVGSGGLWLGIV